MKEQNENKLEIKTKPSGSELNALLSCPCCGGKEPTLLTGGTSPDAVTWKVFCPDCQVRTAIEPTKKAAIYIWNTRYLFENVKMEIDLGEIHQDNQLGNFYNALDQLVCRFQTMTIESDEMFAKMLNVYADRLTGE